MRGFLLALIASAALAACHRATPEELAQAGSERHRAREYAAAIELYQSSLELHDDPAVRANLARAFAAAGKFVEAGAQYRRLLKDEPQNGTLWHDYGVLLESGLNDLAGAEEALFNATKYPPKPPEASYDLGRVLMQRGR
jgi:Flp pilus assembly protein TadD